MLHRNLLVCITLKLFCIYMCALDRNFESRKVIEQGLAWLLDSNGDGRLHSSELVEFLKYFGPLESCMERVLPLFKWTEHSIESEADSNSCMAAQVTGGCVQVVLISLSLSSVRIFILIYIQVDLSQRTRDPRV